MSRTAADILAPFDEAVQERVAEARELVREAVPEATERLHPGWGGFGFRQPEAGHFVGVFPRRAAVALYLMHGLLLPDPDGLFSETGRQTRVVVLPVDREIPRAPLLRLLRSAVGR
jgi:hypothetical protein